MSESTVHLILSFTVSCISVIMIPAKLKATEGNGLFSVHNEKLQNEKSKVYKSDS